MTQQQRTYTLKEIAKILQVSEQTVRRMINDGKLVSIRAGVQIRVTQAALDAYLSQPSAE
jgi:excisionase family DNA binding protein